MFRKLFSRMMRPWQVALIFFGSFTGLLLFWVPLQSYFDITQALEKEKELFSEQYLVLNKEVSVLNALGAKPDGFSEKEIEELNQTKGVKSVGKFTANKFKAFASANFGEGGPVMRTELFFESVPDQFLDERPRGWNWQPSDEDVPIVIPSDYLALYNFGFAPGQNLPQISEDLAKLSAFEIHISGAGKEQLFHGRIAGFSDRINTVLAPQSFIDYCNEQFGEKSEKVPSRIIIQTEDAGALAKTMKEKGYETNNEALKAGKTKTLARNIVFIVLILGGIIILLSLGSFLQFSDLLIARSDAEIRTLSYMGYTNAGISGILFKQVMLFVVISSVLATVVGLVLHWYLQLYLSILIEKPSFMPDTNAIALFAAVMVVYLGLAYLNIRRQTAKLTAGY